MNSPTFDTQFPAIRLKHQGNVLHCCVERTANENFEIVRKVYEALTGFDYFEDEKACDRFAEEGGVVEAYRSS